MPSATRIQYSLPSEAYLDHLLTDDLILRYVKDNYEYAKHSTEFYDTPDWRFTRMSYSMDVDRGLALPIVQLVRARMSPDDLPGLLHGDTWTAPFEDVDTMVDALARRKILVRTCADFGLPGSFWRLAVKTEAENQYLTEILEEILHAR